MLTLILLSILLTAVPTLAQSSPEDVAKAVIAAEESNNPDASMALFADDAVVTLPTGVLDTPEAIRGWQEELAAGHFQLEPVHMQVEGNTVSWDGNISLDRFRDIGIASLDGQWKLVIDNGKIKTFDFTFTPDAFTELTAGSVAAGVVAAEAAHDVDAVMALFADDAVVTLPTGVYKTPAEIRGWQEELAAGNFRIEPEGRYVDGNTVSWTGDISLDLFRRMGIASMAGIWKLVIEDGKVKTFDFTFTPEAFNELTTGSVAAGLIAAEAAHDVDAAVALFADDAVVTLPTGVFDTPEKIRGWQQELADGHFRIEPEGRHVEGNTVSWDGEIALDAFRSMGVPSLGGEWTLVIENGKVKTFDFAFTPDAQKAIQAAQPS